MNFIVVIYFFHPNPNPIIKIYLISLLYIIYYASREEETWTVHSLCELQPCQIRKHEMWAGQFFAHGAYTIFHHTLAESTIFGPALRNILFHHIIPGIKV